MFTAIKDFVLKDIVLEVKNLRSISHLNQLHDSYLPWSGASIQPTALVFLLNDIMINNRKIMVECGAGISTIYVAALMKQLGDKSRKLYTIDHDKNWLSILEKELESQSLNDQVELIHAPLMQSKYCLNEDYTWYDTKVLDVATPKKISTCFLLMDHRQIKKELRNRVILRSPISGISSQKIFS